MLTQETKRKIDSARDILVGKVPDPKAQIDQITTALIYKFMDDMDKDAMELGGKARFFTNGFEKYAWSKILDPRLGGHERLELYAEAITKLWQNNHLPQLFRDIFKDAFLPYRSPETLSLFLKEIDGFTYNHSEDLGDAFEYLLSIMSSQGDAGQFRTPRHIIDFITQVVDPKKDESILDPACGTAGFLISAYKHILKQHDGKNDPEHKEKPLTPDDKKKLMNNLVGYDISPDMVKLSKVNMYLHGFAEPKIYEYDTLSSDEKWDEMYDVIMANPPFMTPKGGIRPHKRFSVQANRAEVLFVDYIKEHLRPNGRAGIIVPEGIIFQSGSAYKNLRKMLVDDNYLWAVVSLPAGVFNPYSGVKTSILFIDRELAKKSDSIVFMKVDQDGYSLSAQRREIKENDLPVVMTLLHSYKRNISSGNIPKTQKLETLTKNTFSIFVPKTKIRGIGDYYLTGERYREINEINHQKWPMVELGDNKYFTIESGGTPDSKNTQYWDGKVAWATLVDLPQENRITHIQSTKRTITESGLKNSSAKLLPVNSVLVSSRASIGRIAINEIPVATNQGFKNIIIKDFETVNPVYLANILITKVDEMLALGSGGTFKEVSKTSFSKIKIPLPPIEIQKEIVGQIEGYQKIVSGAKQVVDVWRPSIKVNSDWQKVSVKEICTLVRGSSPRPKGDKRYYGGPIPRLMISDITRDGMYTTPSTDSLTKDGAKLSRPMNKGDVIMAVSGNPGLPTILTVDACIHDGFVGFRNLSNQVLPEYLYYVLLIQKDENNSQSVGAVFKNLTTDQIKELKIPIPPINVQLEIIDNLKKEHEATKANQEIITTYNTKIQQIIDEIYLGNSSIQKKVNQTELVKHLQDEFESIESEVIRMMGNKKIFEEIVEISKKNSQINQGNSFWDFLKESYIALMVSAVCRQIDTDERSSSLANLLRTILFNPTVIQSLNKDWYSEQYHCDNDIFPGFMEGIGKGDFEEHFGSKEYIDPAIIYIDLKRLEEDTKEIRKYRNKRVAHQDRKEQIFKANYNDLDKAVETVRSLASKYYLLLKQGGNDLIPIDQTDWQKILTVPWIQK